VPEFTSNSPERIPRKLLLLSPDSKEECALRDLLGSSGQQSYTVRRLKSLDQLKEFEIESLCDAVLLDMRIVHSAALEAIEFLAQNKGPIAMICLCRNHTQLEEFHDVMHQIDDYILADSIVVGELPTRVAHAIRKCRREHELICEQNLLKALLDNIPDAIYFKDINSQFIKVNEAMAEAYGKVEPKELLGKSDFDLFTKEHAQPAYIDEQEIIHTGVPLIGKIEKETLADGRINWVTTTKLPLRDTHGSIIGTMGISRNVTDLKATEDALAHETALLKTIIDHALAGIYVKDREGRYLIVNEGHAKYLGAHSPAECIGQTVDRFFDPEQAAKVNAFDTEIIQSGKGKENMIDERRLSNGDHVWLLTSKVPLFDDDGVCTGLVGISQDITLQKKNELQLKSTIQTLEDTKLQLIEAEKLKTVGRLAAGIAHEVKNPLSVVLLGVDYLLSSKLYKNKDIAMMLNDMKQAVLKANDVVFELLDYSSPHEVNMLPASINLTIEHVLGLMRHSMREAHVRLVDERDESLPEVSIDASKIDQVFINLILNAISVMPDGGELTVRTYTKRMREAGSNVSSAMTEHFRIGDTIVVVEILDSGTGIDAKNQAKVFDPFFSTKTTGEGTGLGLSVTRSIVDMHRGMITLENRNDAPGACAQLLFPTADTK
jgi:PAS domain S-box-containing protein